MRTIDIHAHVLTEETIALIGKEIPALKPRLTAIDGDNYVLEVADVPYKPFPLGGFDLERRFADMKAAEVDMQVLSATPQTYFYEQDAGRGAACAAIQNEQIAKLVKAHPEKFLGIATLPMQAPARAAEDTGAFMLIHPNNVAGADRLRSYYLNNLIGNPLDTTIAAACLVFGGVMERHPKLKVCLLHGGGFVPYQAGRWVHGWQVRPEPKLNIKGSPQPYLDRFTFDTILHGRPQLEFLVGSAGAGRVLLGSDYPYDMGTGECVRQVRALAIADADKAKVLEGNALRLFGG